MRFIQNFVIISLALIPVFANAAAILDQANDTDINPYNVISGPTPYADLGQSFTIGVSGILANIEIYGWNQATAYLASREHTLSLFALGSVYVPENALASITQTATSYSEQWFNFDFSEYNLSVSQGDEYLMLWTSDGEFRWMYNSFTYDGGDRFIRNSYYPEGVFIEDRDQIFRSYVTPVPVPSSLVLFCSGIISLITIKSGRRKNSARRI